jgi:hypothetical protein
MSAFPTPEGLADVLRQLVALGGDPPAIGGGNGRGEAKEIDLSCSEVESKERSSGISPLQSLNGNAELEGERDRA